jgi:transposase
MDRAAFDTYIEKVLAPTLDKGDVVILDNLPVHKGLSGISWVGERVII